MAMEALLPSEIARMVYGYLLEERCTDAAKLFLKESSNLEECRQVLSVGRHFSTRVCGLTLLDVLEKFCVLNTIVQEKLEHFDKLDKLRHCSDLTSQIKILFEEYKGKNFIPTVNTATQSSPSLHLSPSKYRKRRIFCNKEDDKEKKIAQAFNEESQDYNNLCQSPSKSVEATPLKNLPGYTGEFELQKHKKLNSKISESNVYKSTPQKSAVSHNVHSQKIQKSHQNIPLQGIEKDEILIKKRCPNINIDLNFQTENLTKHTDTEVQTDLYSVIVLDKNVMTETEQKTCIDTEVQTSDIGSPESEVEVPEILGGFTEKLINRSGVVEKIVENINTELEPIKSNLLEKSNNDDAYSKSIIAQFNKAIETAANKSQNDPEIMDIINEIVCPTEQDLTDKVKFNTQCDVSYLSTQEQISSVSEETVSESSIEKDVIVICSNVNEQKIIESKNSDKGRNPVNPKNVNLEINGSNPTVHHVDPRLNRILTSSTNFQQIDSHNSQITVHKDVRNNTGSVFNSLDSLHLQKRTTNNSENIFTPNNTITSTPIKTSTAIENFEPCDWFSTQDLPTSNTAYYKEEVTKCVATTVPGKYTSNEVIATNTHFLSPITSTDQTLHTPDVLFPPKISTAVTVNSSTAPMNSSQKNKTPTLQKTSEIIDEVLDIQSAQKLDKNLDNMSSELKDSNSNDCNKFFNVDSVMLFGVDSTLSSTPIPMHVQEIEIEDSISLTGTGLSPFLKVIKKSNNTETSTIKECQKPVDNEIIKPNALPTASGDKRIENNVSEFKITENTKYTPKKVIENRHKTTKKSLSTPKKPNSYIRALNFDTPINRSQSESKVNNTDSCLSPDSLKKSLKNSCKSSLFQSPPLTNSEFVEQTANTKILPTILESIEVAESESETWKKDSSLPKKESTVKPVFTEKKSWDSDLRKNLGRNEDITSVSTPATTTSSSSKKRSRSESSRKSYKKSKKDDKNTPKKEKKSYKKSSKKSKNAEKLKSDDKKKEGTKIDKKKEDIKADNKKEDVKSDNKKEDIKSDKKKNVEVDKKKEVTKADKKKVETKTDKKKESVKEDKKEKDLVDKKKEKIKAVQKEEEIKTNKKKEEIEADKKIEPIKRDEKIEAMECDKKKEQIKNDKDTSSKIEIVKETIVPSSTENIKNKQTAEAQGKNFENKPKVSNDRVKEDEKEKEEKRMLEFEKDENEKMEQDEVFEKMRMEIEAELNHNDNAKELEILKETGIVTTSGDIDKKDSENSPFTNKEQIQLPEPKSSIENAEDKSAKQKNDLLVTLLSDSINDDNNEIQSIGKLASNEMLSMSKFNNETINGLTKQNNVAENIQDHEMIQIFETISNELTSKILSENTAVIVDNLTKDVPEKPMETSSSIDYAKVEEQLSRLTTEENPKLVSNRVEVIYDEVNKVERGKIVKKKYARLKTLQEFTLDFETPGKDEDSLQVPPTPQVLSPGSSSLILPLSKMSDDSRTFTSFVATPLECPKTPNIVITPVKGQKEHTSDNPQTTENCYQPAIDSAESAKKPEITQFEVIKENLLKNSKPVTETDPKTEGDNLSTIQAPMSYRESQDEIPSENNDNTSNSSGTCCSCCCGSSTSRSDGSEETEEAEGDAVANNDDDSDEEEESEDGNDAEDEEEDEKVEDDEVIEKEINKPDQEVEKSPTKVLSINKTDNVLAESVQETPAKDGSCIEVKIFDTPNISKPVEQPTNLNTKITQMMILKDQANQVVQIRPKPKIISVKRVLPKVVTKPSIKLIKAHPKNIHLEALEIKRELLTLPPMSQRLKIEKSEEEIALAIKSIENQKFDKSQDDLILSATPSPANKSIEKSVSHKIELAQAIENIAGTATETIEQFSNDESAVDAYDNCNSDANVLEDNYEKDGDKSNDFDREENLNSSHSHNTRFQSRQRREEKEKERKKLSNCSKPCLEIRFFFDEETYKKKRRKGFSEKDLCKMIAEEDHMYILNPTQLETILDIRPKRKKPVRKAQVKKEKSLKVDETSQDSMSTQTCTNDSQSIPDRIANAQNDEAATSNHKRSLEEGEPINKQVVKKRKKNIFLY